MTLTADDSFVPTKPVEKASSKAIVGFSSIGHFYNHLFEPMYFVVALVLPPILDVPYAQVLTLIIAGKLLTGFLAPIVGWLADRWSALGMMAIYFFGFGLSGVAVGFADTPTEIMLALAALGAFGSIYHPVGIAWMVRNSQNRGQALGINGMFGGLGPAAAGVIAGALIEWSSWRTVFIVPGIVVAATGIAFAWAWARGTLKDVPVAHPEPTKLNNSDTIKVYVILTLSMLVGGMFYQVAQSSLPKIFEDELGGLFGAGISGVGTAIMIVYGVGGVMQVVTGHMADRYPLKWVYALFIFLQAPFILLAVASTGVPLFIAAILMVTCNIGALPAENSLLAKYTPGEWQATAYGLKFIIAFGFSGLGIYLTAMVKEATGSFDAMYLAIAAAIVVMAAITTTLPAERPAPKPAAAPQAAE
jgi:MFS family permease